jgi:hypothetical protein
MRRIFVFLTVMLTAILGAQIAQANLRNQPITGDLNSDGRVDRATFSHVIGTTTCTVNVEYRRPDGTYGPAVAHNYESPVVKEPRCPDMGVAVRLRRYGNPDLVGAMFFGSGTQRLFVLRNFALLAQYDGLDFPSAIETADFNGDGLGDIWQSTDQIETMRALLTTSAGTIVPGPFSVCSQVPVPQHYFADFNGDGGQDLLVSRTCRREAHRANAEVFFGNGAPKAVLATADSLGVTLEVFPIDLDSNGIPDAGVIERHSDGTNTVRHFRNDGTGTFTEVPALTAQALPTPYNTPAGTSHH